MPKLLLTHFCYKYKLIDKTYQFGSGVTVVYGKNETGKSTLQSFMTNMLFGYENKNKDSEGRLPDLSKYKPWNHDHYRGSMDVILDSHDKVKIERNFATKECRIFNEHLEDITSTYDYTKREGLKYIVLDVVDNKCTMASYLFIKIQHCVFFK